MPSAKREGRRSVNPARLLNKLSVKAAGYSPRVDSSGFQDISAQDVAAALGTIRGDSGASLVAWSKYGQDVRSLRRLLARLAGFSLSWNLGLEQQRKLVELATRDYLGSDTCLNCNGRAFVMVESAAIMCRRCAGTGLRLPSQRRYAQDLDVTVGEWKGKYAAMHQKLIDLLSDWDREARQSIRRNLLTLGE
jgi:ribosomal protein L40E